MIREELQREKLRKRVRRMFEKRLEEGRGGKLARKCLEELKRRYNEEKTLLKWEKERENFFENRGIRKRERNNEDEI